MLYSEKFGFCLVISIPTPNFHSLILILSFHEPQRSARMMGGRGVGGNSFYERAGSARLLFASLCFHWLKGAHMQYQPIPAQPFPPFASAHPAAQTSQFPSFQSHFTFPVFFFLSHSFKQHHHHHHHHHHIHCCFTLRVPLCSRRIPSRPGSCTSYHIHLQPPYCPGALISRTLRPKQFTHRTNPLYRSIVHLALTQSLSVRLFFHATIDIDSVSSRIAILAIATSNFTQLIESLNFSLHDRERTLTLGVLSSGSSSSHGKVNKLSQHSIN